MAIDSWKIINEDYLTYLRKSESRIPNTDYGKDKFKPFFGVLFEIGDLCYVTQVSSPKPRHYKLKASLDFEKIYYKNSLLAVVNLNYMFPVPEEELISLKYKNLPQYRTFKDVNEMNKYISLLKLELSVIQGLGIESKATAIYSLKTNNPDHIVSKRCFDFKQLEALALNWSNEKYLTHQ